MLITLRPTVKGALPPNQYKKLIGKRAKRAIPTGSPITWKDIVT